MTPRRSDRPPDQKYPLYAVYQQNRRDFLQNVAVAAGTAAIACVAASPLWASGSGAQASSEAVVETTLDERQVAEVRKMLEKLGNSNLEVAQATEDALFAMGTGAIPLLEAANVDLRRDYPGFRPTTKEYNWNEERSRAFSRVLNLLVRLQPGASIGFPTMGPPYVALPKK